jgi:hypothetical protein
VLQQEDAEFVIHSMRSMEQWMVEQTLDIANYFYAHQLFGELFSVFQALQLKQTRRIHVYVT